MSAGDAYTREVGLWEAFRTNDRDRLESLIHPDARDVGPGGALTRDEVLDAVARMRIDAYELADLEERRYGDASVVTYRAAVAGTYAGRPFGHPSVLATSVWVRLDGAWRLVHRAETPLR